MSTVLATMLCVLAAEPTSRPAFEEGVMDALVKRLAPDHPRLGFRPRAGKGVRTFEQVRRSWMHLLPAGGGLALDVGAGSGRDAAWLAEKDVNLIIAGGMGQRARDLFDAKSIGVVVGAPSDKAENLVTAYLGGNLESGENACDH